MPVANISVLILGIGVSITHDAIVDISKYDCTIVWSGMNMNYFYTYGMTATNSSKNIMQQCRCHESKTLHTTVVRNMYHLRYPEEHLKSKSEQELLGLEGIKMQNYYSKLAQEHGIEWKERTYHVEDFDSQDDINKCITTANQLLYSIVCSVIVSLGYSPAIGFVHKGNMLSFVYDISDLYKENLILPFVFAYCGRGENNLRQLRNELFMKLCDIKFMKQIVNDIGYIFSNTISDEKMIEDEVNFEKF